MAWSFVEFQGVKQVHKRWYASATFTNGSVTRRIETRFLTEPTGKELNALRDRIISELDDHDDSAEQKRNPPDLAENLTNGQKTTLKNSVVILQGTRELVPKKLQEEYDEWLQKYTDGLTRLFRSE